MEVQPWSAQAPPLAFSAATNKLASVASPTLRLLTIPEEIIWRILRDVPLADVIFRVCAAAPLLSRMIITRYPLLKRLLEIETSGDPQLLSIIAKTYIQSADQTSIYDAFNDDEELCVQALQPPFALTLARDEDRNIFNCWIEEMPARSSRGVFPFTNIQEIEFSNRSGFNRDERCTRDDVDRVFQQHPRFGTWSILEFDEVEHQKQQIRDQIKAQFTGHFVSQVQPFIKAAMREAYFKVKSSQFDEWYELLCGCDARVRNEDGRIRLCVSLDFDHGS